jgi:hypothetical protein
MFHAGASSTRSGQNYFSFSHATLPQLELYNSGYNTYPRVTIGDRSAGSQQSFLGFGAYYDAGAYRSSGNSTGELPVLIKKSGSVLEIIYHQSATAGAVLVQSAQPYFSMAPDDGFSFVPQINLGSGGTNNNVPVVGDHIIVSNGVDQRYEEGIGWKLYKVDWVSGVFLNCVPASGTPFQIHTNLTIVRIGPTITVTATNTIGVVATGTWDVAGCVALSNTLSTIPEAGFYDGFASSFNHQMCDKQAGTVLGAVQDIAFCVTRLSDTTFRLQMYAGSASGYAAFLGSGSYGFPTTFSVTWNNRDI